MPSFFSHTFSLASDGFFNPGNGAINKHFDVGTIESGYVNPASFTLKLIYNSDPRLTSPALPMAGVDGIACGWFLNVSRLSLPKGGIASAYIDGRYRRLIPKSQSISADSPGYYMLTNNRALEGAVDTVSTDIAGYLNPYEPLLNDTLDSFTTQLLDKTLATYYVLEQCDGTKQYFNAAGLLLRLVSPGGYGISFEYNSSNTAPPYLTRVYNSEGDEIKIDRFTSTAAGTTGTTTITVSKGRSGSIKQQVTLSLTNSTESKLSQPGAESKSLTSLSYCTAAQNEIAITHDFTYQTFTLSDTTSQQLIVEHRSLFERQTYTYCDINKDANSMAKALQNLRRYGVHRPDSPVESYTLSYGTATDKRNYLGYQATTPTTDDEPCMGLSEDYRYITSEEGPHGVLVRTFNRFHDLIELSKPGVPNQNITYTYDVKPGSIAAQPHWVHLPIRTDVSVWLDTPAGATNHLTEARIYDCHGNTTSYVDMAGTTHIYEWVFPHDALPVTPPSQEETGIDPSATAWGEVIQGRRAECLKRYSTHNAYLTTPTIESETTFTSYLGRSYLNPVNPSREINSMAVLPIEFTVLGVPAKRNSYSSAPYPHSLTQALHNLSGTEADTCTAYTYLVGDSKPSSQESPQTFLRTTTACGLLSRTTHDITPLSTTATVELARTGLTLYEVFENGSVQGYKYNNRGQLIQTIDRVAAAATITPPSEDFKKPRTDGLSPAAIAGITLAALVIAGGIVATIVKVLSRRSQQLNNGGRFVRVEQENPNDVFTIDDEDDTVLTMEEFAPITSSDQTTDQAAIQSLMTSGTRDLGIVAPEAFNDAGASFSARTDLLKPVSAALRSAVSSAWTAARRLGRFANCRDVQELSRLDEESVPLGVLESRFSDQLRAFSIAEAQDADEAVIFAADAARTSIDPSYVTDQRTNDDQLDTLQNETEL